MPRIRAKLPFMNFLRLSHWAGMKKGPLPFSSRGYGQVWGFFNTALSRFGVNKVKYDKDVGDPITNSAVAACLGFILRQWPQAVPVAARLTTDGWEPELDHPIVKLLMRPSPSAPFVRFATALFSDFFREGDAYAYIIPGDDNDTPVGLQWLPYGTITAEGDETALIARYLYKVQGKKPIPLDPSEVVHLSHGINPINPRQGVSPLAPAYAEIATDNVATGWQYNLLKRGGLPPYVIGPADKETGGQILPEDMDYIEESMKEVTEGENQGKGLVMPVGFKIEKMGFVPKDMVVGETQRKAEERIAGVIGIPPVVAGLGAGLDRSTFNNYEEARRAAWEDCIIPLQDYFLQELALRLFPRFGEIESDFRIGYDRSGIRCLAEDEAQKVTMAVSAYTAGIISRASAKRRIGEEADEAEEDIYASPGQDETAEPATPPPGKTPPARNDNGKGKGGRNGSTAPFSGEWGRKEAAPVSTIYQAAGRFRQALALNEQAALSSYSDALRTAENSIQERLDALLSRMAEAIENGETINESWLTDEGRLRSLLAQVEAEYQEVGRVGGPGITSAQAAAIESAKRHAPKVGRLALGPIPTGLTAEQAERAKVIASFARLPDTGVFAALIGIAGNGSPVGDLLTAIGPNAADAIRQALIGGVARGDNPRTIAAEMVGLSGIRRARAENIARTETLRAARESTREIYRANSDVLTPRYTRVCSLDSRTCLACWALHGTKWPNASPFVSHPQCRCVMVPEAKSWAEILGDSSISDTRPIIPPGEEIFAGLTESEQRAIMGEGAFRLYQQGAALSEWAVLYDGGVWGESVREATLTEVGAAIGV